MDWIISQQWFLWVTGVCTLAIIALVAVRFARPTLKIIAIGVFLVWIATLIGKKNGLIDEVFIKRCQEKIFHGTNK
ncbi:MAG: hypothetical protein JW795_09120 [Chitinivibrionales bacterium]|nr:hypothetical protein [Chitinivibrionales bacterium]